MFLLTLWPQQVDWPGRFKVTVGAIGMLVAAVAAMYAALIAFRLEYRLNRNGLVIQWGLVRYRVPFDSINTIVTGPTLPQTAALKMVNIAGLRVGWGKLTDYGPVRIFSTAPPEAGLLVVTNEQSYLISPQMPAQFLNAWEARRRLGPTQHWTPGIVRGWPLNIAWLTDRFTWGLFGSALLIFWGLFGYVAFNFAHLPPSLPIHFNALGRADRIADKSALFTLLAGGGLVLVVNLIIGALLYKWEKMAAYLLWGAAILVQIGLGIALYMMIA